MRILRAKTQRQGFTLIEVIVVLVIIGIIASISIPNFSGLIRNYQVKDIVREAKLNEDTCMEITGMQYSLAGNPHVLSAPYVVWDEATDGKQYFYLDAAPNTIATGSAIRGSLANAFSSGTDRNSEGIKEYRLRTNLPFAPATFLPDGNGATTTYLWFQRPTEDQLTNMNTPSPAYYFHYDLLCSEYWFTKDGKNFGVFHNLKWATDSPEGNTGERGDLITPGWFVYEYEGGKWHYYGQRAG